MNIKQMNLNRIINSDIVPKIVTIQFLN